MDENELRPSNLENLADLHSLQIENMIRAALKLADIFEKYMLTLKNTTDMMKEFGKSATVLTSAHPDLADPEVDDVDEQTILDPTSEDYPEGGN